MKSHKLRASLALAFAIGLALTIWAHQTLSRLTAPPPIPADPQRIVSLAPSVTETLFALGQGDRVVAVTQFCHYPPQVLDLPKVAGFTDVNFEAVLRQKPDLVILPIDKAANREELQRLGLAVMGLDTRNLGGYLATVMELGQATGREREAEAIVANLTGAMDAARERAKGKPRPKTLFSVMRAYEGSGRITEITAVGRDGFFSQMLETAGGDNVYQGPLSFPTLTREAIMIMNPGVIVDLVRSGGAEAALADWRSLGPSVDAVRDGRVAIFTEESDNVPGPRIHLTITRLSKALFPPEAATGPAGPEQEAPADGDPPSGQISEPAKPKDGGGHA
jgi:iron complex transport system substrate-binding protein